MDLFLTREPSSKGATLGSLSIALDQFNEDAFTCYTLEDLVREPLGGNLIPDGTLRNQWVQSWKIQNKTAIPRGRYRIELRLSPHFGCVLPHLLGVPGFEYVLIHWGNTAEDTDGCILVGLTKEANLIYKSRDAFRLLFPRIEAAIKSGQEVWITVQ